MLITDVIKQLFYWSANDLGLESCESPQIIRLSDSSVIATWSMTNGGQIHVSSTPISPRIKLEFEELETMYTLLGAADTWDMIVKQYGASPNPQWSVKLMGVHPGET
jgi:hypothetical protein